MQSLPVSYILAFSGDAFIFRELHASEDTVLLRQQFEGKMHALEVATGDIEVAGGGSAGGKDDCVEGG